MVNIGKNYVPKLIMLKYVVLGKDLSIRINDCNAKLIFSPVIEPLLSKTNMNSPV